MFNHFCMREGIDEREIFKKSSLIPAFFKGRFLSMRSPVFVGWDLTYRCNYNCLYCKVPGMSIDNELTSKEVLSG